MGFGHRLYKHGDPRSAIMMDMADQLVSAEEVGPSATSMERKRGEEGGEKGGLREKGPSSLLVELARHIEKRMKEEKHLPSNVDFPCAVVYRM